MSIWEGKTGAIIFGVILFFLTILIGASFRNKIVQDIAAVECCNKHPCSDTYYDFKTNTCHLVLCENSLFTDKSKCVYAGANISFNMT